MVDFVYFSLLAALIIAGVVASVKLFKKQFLSRVTYINVKAKSRVLFVRKESETSCRQYIVFQDETVVVDRSTDTVSVLSPGSIPRITLFLSREDTVYVGFSEEA